MSNHSSHHASYDASSFARVAVRPVSILLPSPEVPAETWACVACDQFTSEPEYWEKADRIAGENPSALRLILPECYLKESAIRVPVIHRTMADYLSRGILTEAVSDGFILCERTLAGGTRLGLIAGVDLEQYSFEKGSLPLVRPTEQTIASRLPARLEIRRGAPVELTHIMILIDDPDRTVLEPLREKKASLRPLYDFDLMLSGGHLAGWAVESGEDLNRVSRALNALAEGKGEHPLLLAVGDGNHSLATAKASWEEIKKTLSPEERETHPARWALCEIVNIHDTALLFEPIHRLLRPVNREALLSAWREYAAARGMALSSGKTGPHCFTLLSGGREETLTVENPEGTIPCETLQLFLDDYLQKHPETEIDYIHGDASLKTLSAAEDTLGFLLPPIDKGSFFRDVEKLGVLPRKTFSMGEANEKRYYMEARKIL